eukprot:381998_1
MSSLKKVNDLLKQLDPQSNNPNNPPEESIENEDENEMKVTGTEVSGIVDYEKLCVQFGCDLLTNDMITKMEKLTNKRVHPMIRRKLYYAHRDFDKILKCHEQGKPWYLYTGRGPSSESMHLGHMIPFIINKHLQDFFNVPIVIQITDDEKFFWKQSITSLEMSKQLARENIKDIIALGFDITKTFIFIDTQYIQYLYPNVCRVQDKVSYNQLKSIFGFEADGISSPSCGKIAYPAIQAVPAFASTFPVPFKGKKDMMCLIPCAIDQDPYFRMTRDVAPKLNEYKCATLYSKFIPGLRGPKGKMSASVGTSAIYLNDTPKDIRRKIMRYAFSGGGDTAELQRKYGAKLEVDTAYQYLTFFMDDDERLKEIGDKYSTGKLLTGEVKNILCDTLIPIITNFQKNRKLVTDDMVDAFLAVRPLQF